MADDNAYVTLMREVVECIEHSTADQRVAGEALARIASDSAASHTALRDEMRRLSESNARIITLWQAEQDSIKNSEKKRDKAVAAIWQSQPLQLLMVGLVLAVLQVIGVGWFAHS